MNPFRYSCQRFVYMRSIRSIHSLIKSNERVRINGMMYRPLGMVSNYHIEAWVKQDINDKLTQEQRDYIYGLARSRSVKVLCFVQNRYQPILTSTLSFDKWLPVSKIRNACMDDHLSDYLEYLNSLENKSIVNGENNQKDNMLTYLSNKGISFEQSVYSYIKTLYPGMTISIGQSYDAGDNNKYTATLDAIKKGYAFIFQAVLWNYKNMTYGCADILVRSDYIKYILPDFDYQYDIPHYVVFDIKLNHDSDLLPYIKSQLCLYNQALGTMQYYEPKNVFIWGKSKIVPLMITDDIKKNTNDAIEWVRNISTVDESNPLLLPNMKTKNISKCNWLKKKIAKDKHELTQLWNVSYKHRNIAHNNGITSLNHPQLTAEKMGITSPIKKAIINKFIKSYQSNDKIIGNITDLGGWKTNRRNYYLDIETICMKHFTNVSNDFIFMIGVGYMDDNKWRFEGMVVSELTENEEKRILQRLVEIIGNDPTFHWGSHERTIILPKLLKYGIVNDTRFYNMNKWFMDEKIIIKGMLNFKLKSVVDAMREQSLSDIQYGCIDNGLDAMYQAWKIYQGDNIISDLDDILDYNEKDCYALAEIHKVLKSEH